MAEIDRDALGERDPRRQLQAIIGDPKCEVAYILGAALQFVLQTGDETDRHLARVADRAIRAELKRMRRILPGLPHMSAILLAALLAISYPQTAQSDSCYWTPQTDGSTRGLCSDANGQTYCLSCPPRGTACYPVPC